MSLPPYFSIEQLTSENLELTKHRLLGAFDVADLQGLVKLFSWLNNIFAEIMKKITEEMPEGPSNLATGFIALSMNSGYRNLGIDKMIPALETLDAEKARKFGPDLVGYFYRAAKLYFRLLQTPSSPTSTSPKLSLSSQRAASPVLSPVVSPVLSPVVSPQRVASPVFSPVASPVLSPVLSPPRVISPVLSPPRVISPVLSLAPTTTQPMTLQLPKLTLSVQQPRVVPQLTLTLPYQPVVRRR